MIMMSEKYEFSDLVPFVVDVPSSLTGFWSPLLLMPWLLITL